MDILFFALVLIVLAAYVAQPLYRDVGTRGVTDEETVRTRAVRALADLEIDRASGLVSEVEYAEQRAELERDAAGDEPTS